MRQSKTFIPTLRDTPKDAEIISHQHLLKGGYIKQTAAGIYTYLPLANRILQNISKIVREELDNIGCAEILMPALQPKDIWVESGRWDAMGDELFRLQDRHKRSFCLGPTHEEVISILIRDHVNTYKKLPLALYQIQTKYRDELRPRFGLMRGREFIMKDLYSFHENAEDLKQFYNKVAEAYHKIYKRCGLDVMQVNADNGAIGGDSSHEFICMTEVGEDTFAHCSKCDFGENNEVNELQAGAACPKCGSPLSLSKGIELGHIFQLGTKYSESMKVNYNNKEQKKTPIVMGCYGIGVSRIIMAIIEQNHKDGKFYWPEEVTPFDVHIIPLDLKDNDLIKYVNELQTKLKEKGLSSLIDDRNERPGVKFQDADLISIKHRIVIGKQFGNGLVEYKNLETNETEDVEVSEIVKKLKK